jgi:hypothetical protein
MVRPRRAVLIDNGKIARAVVGSGLKVNGNIQSIRADHLNALPRPRTKDAVPKFVAICPCCQTKHDGNGDRCEPPHPSSEWKELHQQESAADYSK